MGENRRHEQAVAGDRVAVVGLGLAFCGPFRFFGCSPCRLSVRSGLGLVPLKLFTDAANTACPRGFAIASAATWPLFEL